MMKKVAIAALVFGSVLLADSPQSFSQQVDTQTADATKIGQDVQAALTVANSTGLDGLTLSKAVLTLETAGTLTDGIKINLFIFTLNHTQAKGTTINETLTFGALPKPTGAGPIAQPLTDSLAKAVTAAAAVAAQINVLPFSEGVVKIQFVVQKDNGGSISYKILGVDLGPSVDLKNVSTNTLEVTFTKKP